MTSTLAIQIADAVAAEINSAVAAESFGVLDFTARRSYPDWKDDFEDLKEMAVDVVQAINEDEQVGLANAGALKYTPTIHIVIRKRFEPADREEPTNRLRNSSVDPLVTLLDEIRQHFIARRNTGVLDGLPNVHWDGASQVKRWYEPSKLQMGLFEGYVQLRFNVHEAI